MTNQPDIAALRTSWEEEVRERLEPVRRRLVDARDALDPNQGVSRPDTAEERLVQALDRLDHALPSQGEERDEVTVTLDREETEAVAVELGAISPSESSFEMGSPPFALYGRVIDKLRAALPTTPKEER